MSARKDADRVVAVVALVEGLTKGESLVLGEIVTRVFGWDMERVFLAIDSALAAGLIEKDRGDGRIVVSEKPRARRAVAR